MPVWLLELLLPHPALLVGGILLEAKWPQGNTFVLTATSVSCPELPPAMGSTTHTIPPQKGHLSWAHPVPMRGLSQLRALWLSRDDAKTDPDLTELKTKFLKHAEFSSAQLKGACASQQLGVMCTWSDNTWQNYFQLFTFKNRPQAAFCALGEVIKAGSPLQPSALPHFFCVCECKF